MNMIDKLKSFWNKYPKFVTGLTFTALLIAAIKYYCAGTYCKIIKSMVGKVVVITGANTGIGF